MEGWSKGATDLEIGDSFIRWSIDPSNEKSADSSYSLQYYLENWNDQGKIWIYKGFPVSRAGNYTVKISYKFCTADFGIVNLFRIITGVHAFLPQRGTELTYQDETGNGTDNYQNFLWLDKTYEFSIQPTVDSLWIVIGIGGTYESPRTYYLDSVGISH
jgi:hypothetical protein